MPRSNPRRRELLTDAAIELLAAEGVHGLTHRAVERESALPPGTASNYFPRRDDLLAAAAERVVSLHLEQMKRIDRDTDVSRAADPLVELIAASLQDAVTTSRRRYLAIFELQLEASRRPRLAEALSGLADHSLAATLDEHAKLHLHLPRETVALLITLFGGALFAAVGSPQGLDRPAAQQMALAIVTGARAATVGSRRDEEGPALG